MQVLPLHYVFHHFCHENSLAKITEKSAETTEGVNKAHFPFI